VDLLAIEHNNFQCQKLAAVSLSKKIGTSCPPTFTLWLLTWPFLRVAVFFGND